MRLYEIFKRQEVDQSLPYDEIDPYGTLSHHKERGDKWRGPHEGRYITLMLKGLKPMVLINTGELEYYKEYVNSGQFIKHDITVLTNQYPQYALTLPGQEWRAAKLQKLYDLADEYFAAGKENLWHARQGMLLGYSNEDIRKFITQR